MTRGKRQGILLSSKFYTFALARCYSYLFLNNHILFSEERRRNAKTDRMCAQNHSVSIFYVLEIELKKFQTLTMTDWKSGNLCKG